MKTSPTSLESLLQNCRPALGGLAFGLAIVLSGCGKSEPIDLDVQAETKLLPGGASTPAPGPGSDPTSELGKHLEDAADRTEKAIKEHAPDALKQADDALSDLTESLEPGANETIEELDEEAKKALDEIKEAAEEAGEAIKKSGDSARTDAEAAREATRQVTEAIRKDADKLPAGGK